MKFPLREGRGGSGGEPPKLPPEDHRYPKGVSGNPRGRAAKTDLRAALLRELAKPLPKGSMRLPALPMPLDNVARSLVVAAAKKDKRALRRIREILPPNREPSSELLSSADQAAMASKLLELLHVLYSIKGVLGYYRGVAAAWAEDFWPTINGERITTAEREFLLERARADPHVQQLSSTFKTPIPVARDFASGRLLEQQQLPSPDKRED